MKKYTVLIFFCLVASVFAAGVFAQQGYVGPTAPAAVNGQAAYQAVSVNQLSTLATNKAYVILTGTITQSNGRNTYTFQDATGQIVLKIGTHLWWNLTVGASDRVQILVEVERKRNGRIEVEAKVLRRA